MEPLIQRLVSHRLGLLLGRCAEGSELVLLAAGILATAGRRGICNVRYSPLSSSPFRALTGGRLVGVRVSIHAAHAAGAGGRVGGYMCVHHDSSQEKEQTAAHRSRRPTIGDEQVISAINTERDPIISLL